MTSSLSNQYNSNGEAVNCGEQGGGGVREAAVTDRELGKSVSSLDSHFKA